MGMVFRLLMSVCFFLLLSCGSDDSLSEDVDFNITPKRPNVIESDIVTLKPNQYFLKNTDDGASESTFTGPWFRFSFSLKNGSEKVLHVLSVIVTATLSSGEEKREVFSPSEWTRCGSDEFDTGIYVPNSTGPDFASCDFDYDTNNVKGIQPGETFNLSDEQEKLLVSGLPQDPDGAFVYSVEVKAVGFFGSEDDPSNFSKTITFSTEGL